MSESNNDDQGPKELAHEAWPGFMAAFLVVFLAGLIYLAIILINTMGDGAH